MYTADDVFGIIDALPVADRWAVVEYTLERIKIEVKPEGEVKVGTKNPWIKKIAGSWNDMNEATAKEIEADNSIVDEYDQDLSF
jgi:hypothetical protein